MVKMCGKICGKIEKLSDWKQKIGVIVYIDPNIMIGVCGSSLW